MEYLQYLLEIVITLVLTAVLNLVINGIPSILFKRWYFKNNRDKVLNLVINGIPSILKGFREFEISFYKF